LVVIADVEHRRDLRATLDRRVSGAASVGGNGPRSKRRGHVLVERLPTKPNNGTAYWLASPNGRHEFLHLLFRFPARFHPPVVRWALDAYGKDGGFVLDPFTGSGTVQVEALSRGMSSVGMDVDPLACLIARAKSTPLSRKDLNAGLRKIERVLHTYKDLHKDREAIRGADISVERYKKEAGSLFIPSIPNIMHWFRRYVIVDIGRILWAIEEADLTRAQATFFDACMASVIRRVSNADPAPVSGLEVTTMQSKKNEQRRIKVIDEFMAKVHQVINGMSDLYDHWDGQTVADVIEGDSLDMQLLLSQSQVRKRQFHLAITSPPYCTAVEYSRRHKLEMYWLGLIDDQAEHVDLRHAYIGRPHVRASDWDEDLDLGIPALDRTIERIEGRNEHKARGIRHYFSSMESVLSKMRGAIAANGIAVVVIGDSHCCGVRVRTADFLAEIGSEYFRLTKRFSYALRNQYMQYGLWNGHGINKEHVLVFKRK
jgi:DNA modification methylase